MNVSLDLRIRIALVQVQIVFFVRFGELFQNVVDIIIRESVDPRLYQSVQRRLVCFEHHIITYRNKFQYMLYKV